MESGLYFLLCTIYLPGVSPRLMISSLSNALATALYTYVRPEPLSYLLTICFSLDPTEWHLTFQKTCHFPQQQTSKQASTVHKTVYFYHFFFPCSRSIHALSDLLLSHFITCSGVSFSFSYPSKLIPDFGKQKNERKMRRSLYMDC